MNRAFFDTWLTEKRIDDDRLRVIGQDIGLKSCAFGLDFFFQMTEKLFIRGTRFAILVKAVIDDFRKVERGDIRNISAVGNNKFPTCRNAVIVRVGGRIAKLDQSRNHDVVV